MHTNDHFGEALPEVGAADVGESGRYCRPHTAPYANLLRARVGFAAGRKRNDRFSAKGQSLLPALLGCAPEGFEGMARRHAAGIRCGIGPIMCQLAHLMAVSLVPARPLPAMSATRACLFRRIPRAVPVRRSDLPSTESSFVHRQRLRVPSFPLLPLPEYGGGYPSAAPIGTFVVSQAV